ncbi:MAG: hypothetical protein QM784_36440 [Polyangiaceae bacterium]
MTYRTSKGRVECQRPQIDFHVANLFAKLSRETLRGAADRCVVAQYRNQHGGRGIHHAQGKAMRQMDLLHVAQNVECRCESRRFRVGERLRGWPKEDPSVGGDVEDSHFRRMRSVTSIVPARADYTLLLSECLQQFNGRTRPGSDGPVQNGSELIASNP